MENTITELNTSKKNLLRLDWLLSILIAPAKTLKKITTEEKPIWLTPLLLLSVLILISVLVAGPIQKKIVEMGMNIPENFMYYSQEQQAQFMSAQANRTSPLFLYVFPILTKLAGLWISWFLLSSLLHLSLTLSGSRASNTRSYNLAGWSLVPLGLRFVVQILAMFFTKTLVTSPGLSGFVAGDVSGAAAFFSALMGLIDLYFIWQILLLLIGVLPLSGLVKSKAWMATAISVLILMIIQALPGILSHALSGLSTSTPFYF